jgi:hypothetical protein
MKAITSNDWVFLGVSLVFFTWVAMPSHNPFLIMAGMGYGFFLSMQDWCRSDRTRDTIP